MTIPVPSDRLAATIASFGSAILITQRYDAQGQRDFVKVHVVDPRVVGNDVVVPGLRESMRRNVGADPHVTLVWPATQHHGWTLIVDGMAGADHDALRVSVASAMLHRPRGHSDGPGWAFPAQG